MGGKKCLATRGRTLADKRQEAYAKAMAISFSPRADVLSVPPRHSLRSQRQHASLPKHKNKTPDRLLLEKQSYM